MSAKRWCILAVAVVSGIILLGRSGALAWQEPVRNTANAAPLELPDLSSKAMVEGSIRQVVRVQPEVEVTQSIRSLKETNSTEITLQVRNSGSVPVQDVSCRAELPEGVTLHESEPAAERIRSAISWGLGAMKQGEGRSIRLVLRGKSGGNGPRLPVWLSFQVADRQIEAPKRPTVVLRAGSGMVGMPLTMQVTIHNPGSETMRGASLRILLPSGLTHAAGSDLTNRIDQVEAGKTLSIPLTVRPVRAGKMMVKMLLTPAEGDRVEEEQSLEVLPDPSTVAVTGPAVCTVGESFLYHIDVNNGWARPNESVRITAELSDGVAFVHAEGGIYDPVTHSVIWTINDLPAGQAKRLALRSVARQPGSQECKVSFTVGTEQIKKASWTVKVTQSTPQSGTNGDRRRR